MIEVVYEPQFNCAVGGETTFGDGSTVEPYMRAKKAIPLGARFRHTMCATAMVRQLSCEVPAFRDRGATRSPSLRSGTAFHCSTPHGHTNHQSTMTSPPPILEVVRPQLSRPLHPGQSVQGDVEVGEVLAEARTRGLLSIGERAKLRLATGEP
eukprot:SAG31_NODE_10615_length_1117_cov_1.468566_1_plen_152_part_01